MTLELLKRRRELLARRAQMHDEQVAILEQRLTRLRSERDKAYGRVEEADDLIIEEEARAAPKANPVLQNPPPAPTSASNP